MISGRSAFNQANGFGRVDTPRYYVPLTAIGWAAFRLGFHQSMAERLPEAVAGRFRDLRAAWYDRKYRAVEAF